MHTCLIFNVFQLNRCVEMDISIFFTLNIIVIRSPKGLALELFVIHSLSTGARVHPLGQYTRPQTTAQPRPWPTPARSVPALPLLLQRDPGLDGNGYPVLEMGL